MAGQARLLDGYPLTILLEQSMSWTLRVYAGKGLWNEERFAHPRLADEAWERQIRVMPNCPAELIQNVLVRSHLT